MSQIDRSRLTFELVRRPQWLPFSEKRSGFIMTGSITQKVAALGRQLPQVAAPAGNYVSTVRVGNLLFVAGQIGSHVHGSGYAGRIGADFDVEQGRQAAQAACLNVLAQIVAVTNDRVSAVRRVARLGVFVASTPEFTRQLDVANGASDLIAAVFGEAGKHARAAVGVASLPHGALVEVDAIIELTEV
ncbi:RidA family protein [Dongia deserti]|uniref:RidA family protein n=1 Tax=Dongia deserti TaxID=2268030 RepID=UPI002546D2E4|nr:RidA family protein [Dongia deserti]